MSYKRNIHSSLQSILDTTMEPSTPDKNDRTLDDSVDDSVPSPIADQHSAITEKVDDSDTNRKVSFKHRKPYESSKKSFGSFPCKVGPSADACELEYISSLMQNAEIIARKDGTISSRDIAPYLSSRYGMEITPEQAVDIATSLCGGKKRGDFAAEIDARDQEMMKEMNGSICDGDDGHDEKKTADEEEEEIYYFDLVQVMSLLLIPELVGFAKEVNGNKKLLTEDDKPKLSVEPEDLVQIVIESMIEIFDEEIAQKLRDGGNLDLKMLRQILLAFGDVDSANNPLLLQEMLHVLGGEEASLTSKTLLHALTSDVKSSFTEKTVTPPSVGETSTFFDVFGWNWDETPKEDETKGNAPRPTKTASFIDYAADTYGSVVLNTVIWSLFILTTLVYLNFFRTYFDTLTADLICASTKSFGCDVGNKVVSWVLTALFFGLYGLVFLVPTSVGNVAGKTPMIYFTLFVTAAFTFAPFGTLINYRKGSPHNAITYTEYRVICPSIFPPEVYKAIQDPGLFIDFDDPFLNGGYSNATEAEREAGMKKLRDERDQLAAQMAIYLDYDPKSTQEWCRRHPEVQGRYIDPDPDVLSYSELEKCKNFIDGWFGPDYLEAWLVSGSVCPYGLQYDKCNCAYKFYPPIDDNTTVCCHNDAYMFTTNETTGEGYYVCDHQPLGSSCFDDALCESGRCVDNICVRDEKETQKLIGEPCGQDHAKCKTNFCWNGFCEEEPWIYPVNKENIDPEVFFDPETAALSAVNYEKFGGFRLDPFCRTEERWCELNDFSLLEDSLNYFNETLYNITNSLVAIHGEDWVRQNPEIVEEIQNMENEFNSSECAAAAFILATNGIIKAINETDAEIGNEYVENNYDAIEEALQDDWTYFFLVAIAVVGGVAVLAILVKIISNNVDDRPRDYYTKLAGDKKIASVIENALDMHESAVQSKGQVMRNYFLHGEAYVEIGGLIWAIKKMVSGDLAKEEGIRYPGRIWIGQVVQVTVTIVVVAFAFAGVNELATWLQEYRDELGFSISAEAALKLSNYEYSKLVEDELIVTPEEQTQLDNLPEVWMVRVSGYIAATTGLLVAIFCTLVYIPSTTSTTLKLRNGMMPSLHDPYFSSMKTTPDNVIQNVGNMVFSLLGASIMMGLLIGVIVFAFCYPFTREFLLTFVATAIGIMVTILIKMVGQKALRRRNFSSFYRKKPVSANYANLFFECWYIGTGLLVVVSRLITFLIAGALWLGRIDVEFLHPDVKVRGVGIDKIPQSFTRDLLVHEAHNHPYIERLGGIYLRRVKDGDSFGTVAGTTWRSLFACGLMPWIVRYRVNNSKDVIPMDAEPSRIDL